MPIHPTYPGVYVQEEPSGVRTITGVSTSIATFIGRTKMGPMLDPTLCLNFTEFERTFSADSSMSEMANAVRLFFLNGGAQCYIVRIAAGAATLDPSSVTLKNEAKVDTIKVTAKSAGKVGDDIRLAVTYSGLQPEALFNLEVFRWEKNAAGISIKKDSEMWASLSMNPKHPRYAEKYVNANSKLINLKDLLITPAANGYSQSGLIPKNVLDNTLNNKSFRISVNGSTFVNVSLGAGKVTDITAVPNPFETAINLALGAASIVDMVKVSPPSPVGASKFRLKIDCTAGDVFIQPAFISTDDITGQLMLGTEQGGIEVAKFAMNRPAANGIVFNIGNIDTLAVLPQSTFKRIQLVPTSTNSPFVSVIIETSGPAKPLYEDKIMGSITGNVDGIREKWEIIAKAINEQSGITKDPAFPWSAEVWGSRLAIIPINGADNGQGILTTSDGAAAGNIGNGAPTNFFIENQRYSILTGGEAKAPTKTDYDAAYNKIDTEVDIFNLMILPRDLEHDAQTTLSLWGEASVFCQKRRAFLLIDSPIIWNTVQIATNQKDGVPKLRIGLVKTHSAVFHPRLTIQENGSDKQIGATGAIAGLMARTDSNRGVWKAAAGTEADMRGVSGLEYRFTDDQNGVLNPHAINTIRIFPNGIVNWGARTMAGDDDEGSEWKYIPVRRTALFIEESLYRGLKWVVFEPNDEPLWSQIRLNVGAFMHNLFRQGAFQGQQKKDAYFVKCDSETTTQNDINLGIVNVWVGFAPLKPAEFVILHLQQMTGQIQV